MILGHEKVNFLYLPTPLEKLENLSADLGVNFYIKRDDLTPLATGGNKLRKLEYFMADAKAKGATLLLTVGGIQTNHGRLTLAVARKYGLKGAIVTVDKYPGEVSANLLLDSMMGCDVWVKEPYEGCDEDALLEETVRKVTEQYEAQGEKVYYIPMGGSNELGTLGYYECAMEISKQAQEMGIENPLVIDTVGSMGTYLGLFLGIANEKLPMRLKGVGILPYDSIIGEAMAYFDRCCDFFGLEELRKEVKAANAEGAEAKDPRLVFDATSDYDRGAYNNPCKEVRDAMYYMAEKEALILDPCYTGKTFAAILEMIKEGKIQKGENIIFMHTGGTPGINTPFHRIEMEKERGHFVHIL